MLVLTMPGPFFTGGGPSFTYSLLDRFNTDQASPMTFPRTSDPGPGTLTLGGTNVAYSVAGGRLLVNGTLTANDRIYGTTILARACGRGFLWTVANRTTIGANNRVGLFASNSTGSSSDAGVVYTATANQVGIKMAGLTSTLYTWIVGVNDHHFAAVMRANGYWLLARDSGSTNYTLLAVTNAGTTGEYSKIICPTGAAYNFALDDWRATDLGGIWATDFGPATVQLTSPAAATTTATSTGDALVEWTFTFDGTAKDVWTRRTDVNNGFKWSATAAGAFVLTRVQAGVPTVLQTVASVFVAATVYRVLVVQDGSNLLASVNNVSRITPKTDTFNQTATGVVIDHSGVTELVCWPRFFDLGGA